MPVEKRKPEVLYNSYNLFPCARPAHVGESGLGPPDQLQVLQNRGSRMAILLFRFKTLSAQDRHLPGEFWGPWEKNSKTRCSIIQKLAAVLKIQKLAALKPS